MPAKCDKCDTFVALSNELVTISGWYGPREYVWRNGKLVLLRTLCDKHKDQHLINESVKNIKHLLGED